MKNQKRLFKYLKNGHKEQNEDTKCTKCLLRVLGEPLVFVVS